MTATTNAQTDRDLFIEELCAEFDLQPLQIRFDERGEPVLDFAALQIVTHALCSEIKEDKVEPWRIMEDDSYVTCLAELVLEDGRRISRYGFASIGESLGAERIENTAQAISVASARAYRQALRAIGFNPIRAYRLRQSGQKLQLTPMASNADNRSRELHALATELGYIKNGDRTLYVELLKLMYGKASSVLLSATELDELITFLRGHSLRKKREQEAKAA